MKRLKSGGLANGLIPVTRPCSTPSPTHALVKTMASSHLTGWRGQPLCRLRDDTKLIALDLFPSVSGFIQHIPELILGGHIRYHHGLSHAYRATRAVKPPGNHDGTFLSSSSLTLLSSGIAAGDITVIVLNLLFPQEK